MFLSSCKIVAIYSTSSSFNCFDSVLLISSSPEVEFMPCFEPCRFSGAGGALGCPASFFSLFNIPNSPFFYLICLNQDVIS